LLAEELKDRFVCKSATDVDKYEFLMGMITFETEHSKDFLEVCDPNGQSLILVSNPKLQVNTVGNVYINITQDTEIVLLSTINKFEPSDGPELVCDDE
jgi:hypothetical protein